MAVIADSMKITSPVPLSMVFKALVHDSHGNQQQIFLEDSKSVEFTEGDGGVGSIKKTNYDENDGQHRQTRKEERLTSRPLNPTSFAFNFEWRRTPIGLGYEYQANMRIITCSMEIKSVVAPSRMFKALVLDSHNILPKIVPEVIKSIEFIKGDGGVGSIKKTNFNECFQIKYTMDRIDALDSHSFYYKYAFIGSNVKFDKIDCVVCEMKFIVADDGCVYKMTSKYHVKEHCELIMKEEDIKQAKERAMRLFKAVEEYLVANPDVCA